MKNKIVTVALSVLLIASVGLNVWQYTNYNSLKVQTDNLQTEITNLNESLVSLDNDISTKNEEISTLSEKITELENSIQTLEAENESLTAQLNASVEAEIVDEESSIDINIDDENVESLTSEEIAQQIIADFLKEHAENNTIHVDVPGTTPHDPSKDGEYVYGQGGEMPEYVKGKG